MGPPKLRAHPNWSPCIWQGAQYGIRMHGVALKPLSLGAPLWRERGACPQLTLPNPTLPRPLGTEIMVAGLDPLLASEEGPPAGWGVQPPDYTPPKLRAHPNWTPCIRQGPQYGIRMHGVALKPLSLRAPLWRERGLVPQLSLPNPRSLGPLAPRS